MNLNNYYYKNNININFKYNLMFAEFAIIPVTNSFESVANEIQDKLNGCSLTNITSSIDTNYSLPIAIRINNWRDIQYDTIMIDQDYNETKTILVKFYDNNTIIE